MYPTFNHFFVLNEMIDIIFFEKLLMLVIGIWHVVLIFVAPPVRYPDLLTLLLMEFCFTHFATSFLFVVKIQFVEWYNQSITSKKTKVE
jgi:hypothetical protein